MGCLTRFTPVCSLRESVIILSLVLSIAAASSSKWEAPHLHQTDSSLSPLRVVSTKNYRGELLFVNNTGQMRSFNFLDKGLSCSVFG